MATKEDIQAAYNYQDELVRSGLGENADFSCAYFNGDFSLTLDQAQEAKHQYILDSLCVEPGMRVLDIGCGWGPMLKAIKERGAHGVGITLADTQAEACRRAGFDVHILDWRDMKPDQFGKFDAISCVEAIEHFASREDFRAGKQEAIYERFFDFCGRILAPGGRMYVQATLLGKRVNPHDYFSPKAPVGSDEHIMATIEYFFPGSCPPLDFEMIERCSQPFFRVLEHNNAHADMLETAKRWNQHAFKFNLRNVIAGLKTARYLFTDKDFIPKAQGLLRGYNIQFWERQLADMERVVLERV